MLQTTAVELAGVDRAGADGAIWSLPHGGDLDANLVQLAAAGAMTEHVNDEVDVLIVGIAGSGTVTVGAEPYPLAASTLVAVPKGVRRAISADAPAGLVYLTVHRARAGLHIGR